VSKKKMTIIQLEAMANTLRKDVLRMLEEAGSGHTAGPLDLADIFSALYFDILNIDPKNPTWEKRDMFVLSAGHLAPIMYAAMAERGFFPKKELMTLRKYGSRLQGHPERTLLPGVETTAGPLGNGLGQAVGMAYAMQMEDDHSRWVYCVTGDGELDEGVIWESAMFAGKNKLHKLITIVDRNNIQLDGPTEHIMPLEDLKEKWEAFGWHVIEIDGHNIEAVIDACSMGRAIVEKPTVIIAHTIPGKGVDFMEFDFHWHGMPPNSKQAKEALHKLRTLDGKIRSEHE